MRASKQRVVLAGAGFFLLLSSSLSLMQQSLQRSSVGHHANKYHTNVTYKGTGVHLPMHPLKVGELSAAVTEFHSDAAAAARIAGRCDNMVLQPGRSFLLTLPNHRELRFDNLSADPVIIKSSMSQQQLNLAFYKGSY